MERGSIQRLLRQELASGIEQVGMHVGVACQRTDPQADGCVQGQLADVVGHDSLVERAE